MASGGAALLLCAVFFLSTAHPVCSCPDISQVSCEERPPHFEDWQPCGNNSFRCMGSTMELLFGGSEILFNVVRTDVTEDGLLMLEIEDPTLRHIFANTKLDFLYSFPPPGPHFTPPRVSQTSLQELQALSDNPSHYIQLLSELIKIYQGTCTAYDLCYTSKESRDFHDPALANTCLPAPVRPTVIWKLFMNNNSNSEGAFNVITVGFSRRHRLHPDCFNCRMTGGHCDVDSGSVGNDGEEHPPLRTKHQDTQRKLIIIGVSIATALPLLAGFLLYLWCRKKKTKTAPTSSTSLFTSEGSWNEDCEAPSENYPTHVFTYEELHEATNGFSSSNELDQGGHATVYGGNLRDGRRVAVKRLHQNGCKRAEQFLNEMAILSQLRHPNLVALYGCTSRHSRELLLVYEFLPSGTIADHLHGRRATEGALTWPIRLRIAVETATALAYLHATEPQIVHRDVKTNNILLDRDFHVKVADFGLSRLFPMGASHVSTVPQGTPGYVDPEYHRCFQLTDKSDVYSFGVVLAELISSKPAVDVTRCRLEINLSTMALNKIQNAAIKELVDPKLGFETDLAVRRSIEMVAKLVMRCLQREGDMRPTMEDVLEVLHGIEDGFHQAE